MFSSNNASYAYPDPANNNNNNMYNAIDNYAANLGHDCKNVFSHIGNDKVRRRPSQFDRAVHRAYAEPRPFFHSHPLAERAFQRVYWALRAVQFRIFYKNEEMDIDDASDKWEIGVQPPPLDQLARRTRFSPRWIKYMYSKFKNECPTGRMRESEFRKLLASIIAPEKATDQYINRLFLAFSGSDTNTITFENLVDCLAHINPQTAESNAHWTMRLITGNDSNLFAFPAFLAFTQSVFALNEGRATTDDVNKESIQQRASTIFMELDSDHDGLVTNEDLIRFFQGYSQSNVVFRRSSVRSSPSTTL